MVLINSLVMLVLLDEFVDWLQEKGYWFGAELAKHPLTGEEFDAAWKWLANSDNAKDFEEAKINM